MHVCVCKDSAAPAHARTRAHRPAAPHQSQSSGVSPAPAMREADDTLCGRGRVMLYALYAVCCTCVMM